MLNSKKLISAFFISSFFINLFCAGVKFEDFSVSGSLKGKDLGGHTAIVEESGAVFEKCSNGEIKVSSSVGPGLITLKNCHNISVILESGACLLVDNKTEIDRLYFFDNASVNSLEVFQAELKNKQINLKKKGHIKSIFIESGFSPLIQNIDFDSKQEFTSGTDKDYRKLKISQDKTYKGLGVRFIIENFPKEADCLYVLLSDGGSEKEIEWISPERNKDRFYSGFYDYEFLDKGKEYEFIFWYAKGTETLSKYYIKVVPSKGINVTVNKDDAAVTIDEETGVISWDKVPQAELPEESQLVYEIISVDKNFNWHYVGNYVTGCEDFNPVSIYEDFSWHYPDHVIDKKVMIHIYFAYKTFRWPVIKETSQFKIVKAYE